MTLPERMLQLTDLGLPLTTLKENLSIVVSIKPRPIVKLTPLANGMGEVQGKDAKESHIRTTLGKEFRLRDLLV